MKHRVFGIDLGTTYSCIAALNDIGEPFVLKNSEGESITPSVVYFDGPLQVSVGNTAKENSSLYPDQVVELFKRSIGHPGFTYYVRGKNWLPEELSAFVLKKLVEDGEQELRELGYLSSRETIRDVVITCPAYFGIAERTATENAGKIAGLNVLSIINEPTVAAICYGVSQEEESGRTVMVYDLGGGTFDVTVIRVEQEELRVVCTGGDDQLGGRDWDERILLFLAEQYREESGEEESLLEDSYTVQELSVTAERAKKLLSSKEKAPVTFAYKGERFRFELSRQKFNEITEDLLERTISYTREVLKEAAMKGVSSVDSILLVGGSTRMPQIRERLEQEFAVPVRMFEPDYAVAKGAAIYAGRRSQYEEKLVSIAKNQRKTVSRLKKQIESGQLSLPEAAKKANVDLRLKGTAGKEKIINVTSRSFGGTLYYQGERKICITIPKNTELPATEKLTTHPRHPENPVVEWDIMETLATEKYVDPALGRVIGHIIMKLPRNATKETKITETYCMDEAGLLHVHAVIDGGEELDVEFQTTATMNEKDMNASMRRIAAVQMI